MSEPSERLDAAIALHEAGAFDAASAIYREILADDPLNHESLHLLGLIAHGHGDLPVAIDVIRRAVDLQPFAAHYRNNLGNALRSAGRLDEAAAALMVARALRPQSATIASNLGSMLAELGQLTEAIRLLREAIELDPALPDAHYNLANALCRAEQPGSALTVYADCLRLRPDFADAHFNLGHALDLLGRRTEAQAAYRAALRCDPNHVDAMTNLGVLLQQADQASDAEVLFAAAHHLRPEQHAIACNLGAALLAQGRTEEAASCFAGVLLAAPDHGGARLGRLVAHLPVVPIDEAHARPARNDYAAALTRLGRDLDEAGPDSPLATSLAAAAGDYLPCYLAYQGENDRALQVDYGALMQRLAAPVGRAVTLPKTGEKLRIGIVSGFFREHTIWTLFLRGWLDQLDPARFELFGYHTGPVRDAWTDHAATRCRNFTEGRRSVDAWRQAVQADRPDVLLYPEIGLDPVAARLACIRLAAVQCVAWGHPVTTGLPSLDYFLSSALMEPPDADAHYTERLVKLPNLGIFHEPDWWHEAPPERAAIGLRANAVVYWSGQNLPKYLPRHDDVFARIACEVPDSQFVFIRFGHGEAMTRRFADRLDRAFARVGLTAAHHCVILPQMSQQQFLGVASLCEVVLDTIGWSGGKSTLDLLAVDPVILTVAGRFMRGRHTAAILRLAGVADTVVASVDDYVRMAVRLGRDPALRQDLRARLATGKHRVFRDRTAIEALEGFLERAVGPA